MKRISGTDDTIVAVEIVVEPFEVQVPSVAIPVKVWDVPIAVLIQPNRSYKISSLALPLECSQGCIEYRTSKSFNILYQVASFFRN